MLRKVELLCREGWRFSKEVLRDRCSQPESSALQITPDSGLIGLFCTQVPWDICLIRGHSYFNFYFFLYFWGLFWQACINVLLMVPFIGVQRNIEEEQRGRVRGRRGATMNVSLCCPCFLRAVLLFLMTGRKNFKVLLNVSSPANLVIW